ncbi:MAG: sensor histidine kinase [Gammaproteobacteria bacterium]
MDYRQFQTALLLVALLTAGGTLLVLVLVRPLARALEERVRERTAEVQCLNAELEERVRRRTAELTAANQELESFSYSVSHDLRAPLRHIHGLSDLLWRQHEAKLDDEGRRYLSKISDSAQQMGVLIDELLTFSRIGRAELQRTQVDLRELVEEVWDLLQPEMGGRDIWALGACRT